MSVIYDTYTFLRALSDNSPESQALIHSNRRRHIIYYSSPIMKEYLSKAHSHGMSGTIFNRKMREFFGNFRTKKIGRELLEQARSEIIINRCILCGDVDDHKFIEAALAGKVKFVITSDHGLLGLFPYCCNGTKIDFIDFLAYINLR